MSDASNDPDITAELCAMRATLTALSQTASEMGDTLSASLLATVADLLAASPPFATTGHNCSG